MNPVALQLGPISIRWYAICIVSGLILAVYLSMKEAPRKQINPDDIIDFILIAFPLAIVGARLYYVIFEWGYYSQHLGEIFAILERRNRDLWWPLDRVHWFLYLFFSQTFD